MFLTSFFFGKFEALRSYVYQQASRFSISPKVGEKRIDNYTDTEIEVSIQNPIMIIHPTCSFTEKKEEEKTSIKGVAERSSVFASEIFTANIPNP